MKFVRKTFAERFIWRVVEDEIKLKVFRRKSSHDYRSHLTTPGCRRVEAIVLQVYREKSELEKEIS